MNIDIAALRAVEREREISFDTIIEAIETALLTAYKHTGHTHPAARVEVVPGAGHAVQSDQPLALARLINDLVTVESDY